MKAKQSLEESVNLTDREIQEMMDKRIAYLTNASGLLTDTDNKVARKYGTDHFHIDRGITLYKWVRIYFDYIRKWKK